MIAGPRRSGGTPVAVTLRRLVATLALLVLLGTSTAMAEMYTVRGALRTYRDNVTPLVEETLQLHRAVDDANAGLHSHAASGQQVHLHEYTAARAQSRERMATVLRLGEPLPDRDIDEAQTDMDRWFAMADAASAMPDQERREQAVRDLQPQFHALQASLTELERESTVYRDERRNAYFRLIDVALLVMLGAGVLGIVAISFVSWRAFREVGHPIRAMRGVVDDRSRGVLRDADEFGGPAELRTLAASFNRLSARNEELARQQRHTLEMTRLSTSIASILGDPTPASWQLAVAELGRGIGVDTVVAYGIDDPGQLRPHLEAEWTRHGTSRADLIVGSATAHRSELDTLARRSVTAASNPVEICETFPPHLAALALGEGARSWAVRPLELADETIGLLSLWSRTEHEWTSAELATVERCSGYLAQALATGQVLSSLRMLDQERSRFMAVTSHELRTPLTSIGGYVEMLAEGDFGDLTDAQCEALDVVDRNVVRLSDLISDLLTLNRMGSGAVSLHSRLLRPHDGLRRARENFLPAATLAGVNLVLHEPDPDLYLMGDEVKLDRALGNLVSNALKFTPSGGTVTIAAQERGDDVVISVTDTGIGIPAEDQATIFDPFTRGRNATAREIQGTGLGLPIVRGTAEEHGGWVELESKEDVGTTIRLVLPRATPEQVAAARPA